MTRVGAILCSLLLACCVLSNAESVADKVKNIVIITEENWSFDGLFGLFPGAENILKASQSIQNNPQVDLDGKAYEHLPQDAHGLLPANLTNEPFDAHLYFFNYTSPDLTHRFYQEQYQINGGRMDRFVPFGGDLPWSGSDNRNFPGGAVYSYYDVTELGPTGEELYLGQLAKNYTLLDRFHHSAFGGSFLNHQWLICACSPFYPNAPEGALSVVDRNNDFSPIGKVLVDRVLTDDGYAVNTMYSSQPPLASFRNVNNTLPPLNDTTIGDLLSEKNVSWAWYSGGYDDAMAGHADSLFQYHHQPFTYYTKYANDTEARKLHLKDETDFFFALKNNSLPTVSFVKPSGRYNMHPSESTILDGMQKLKDYIDAVENSIYWDNTLIIIIWDENGGRWDHVAPPAGDRWGPGSRVPGLLVGPLAQRGKIDSTQLETLSVVKFLEEKFNLNGTIIPSTRKVTSIAAALEPTPSPTPDGGHHGGISPQVAIAIGIVVGVALLVVIIVFVLRYYQRKKYEFIQL